MNLNEIFSFPVENKSAEAKKAIKNHYCKFLDGKCDKQSRMTNYPMGVCSVNYSEAKPIICQHRFLQDNKVFKDISKEIFGTTNNVLLFSEVHLSNIGSKKLNFLKPIHKILLNFKI